MPMDSQPAVICACAARPLGPTVTLLQSSYTELSDFSVEDSHVLPHEYIPGQTIYMRPGVRGGGAIRVVEGSIYIRRGSFTRCSAGPLNGDFDSCARSFSASTGLCTDGLGGAISGDRTRIQGQTTGWMRRVSDFACSAAECGPVLCWLPLTALWVSLSTFCMSTQ